MNLLRVNVNFGSSADRESFELFDDASFRAMAPVEKRGNYCNAHVSASDDVESEPIPVRWRIERKLRDGASGIKFPAIARNKHL